MNKKEIEQEVLNTLKNGFGLTSAEQVILDIYIDKLQEENEKLKYEHLEADELTKTLQENNLSYQKELAKAWKENEELKQENKKQYKQFIKDHTEVIEALKKEQEDKIRTRIKELEEKCEAMKKTYTGTYALNGNYLEAFYQIVILRELLGE